LCDRTGDSKRRAGETPREGLLGGIIVIGGISELACETRDR
jgi:hypothetical protein